MKSIICAISLIVGLSAHANVGDKYSAFAKIGRVSPIQGVVELLAFSALADHDNNVATPAILVKTQIDAETGSGAVDISDVMENVLQGVRRDKLTIGIVYALADVAKTDKCVGKEYQYADNENLWGNNLTCYKVQIKDFMIK